MPEQPRWTEYVRLDSVLRAQRNPKLHDAELIRQSISRFGVVELPAVDERTGRLVAGHGRLNEWERARESGEHPPDGVTVDDNGDWQVPLLRGWQSRSDDEAEAYLIVSNRSTELGGWDEIELSQVLHDLKDADLLELTGYGDDDLAKFDGEDDTADAGDDEDPEPEGLPSFGVMVLCDDEEDQSYTLEKLSELRYRCRPVSR